MPDKEKGPITRSPGIGPFLKQLLFRYRIR
jgi:hypothetical protein